MPQKENQLGKQNPENTGHRLPENHIVVEANLRKRQIFFTVTIVIEEVFEITLEFGDIHHNRIFIQPLNNFQLLIVRLNSGIEALQNQV